MNMEFDAVITGAGPAGGGGAQVALPVDAAQVFGTRARFPVVATFNGIAYRGSTMPMGDGTFCLGLTRAIRDAAGLDVGNQVHVVVARDEGERRVDVPPDLAAALAGAQLTAKFESMAYTHRKEYARWVLEAKKPETRRRRVAQAIERIAAGIPFS